MVRNTYENIVNGIEIRKNLSLLRQELKDSTQKQALLYFLGGDYTVFEKLLSDEDPKVRKNVAYIIGSLKDQRLLDSLFQAYEKEETLFVKSAYLLAMKEYDFQKYAGKLKKRLEELSKIEWTPENKKHITEEMRAISDLFIISEGTTSHKFKGKHQKSELILLTNRNYTDRIREELPEEVEAKSFNAGIILQTDNLDEIENLRYYEELLFVVPGMKTCSMKPEEAAKKIVGADLVEFIKNRHTGKAPFYFRIECKSKLPMDKRSRLTKQLASEIERRTNRQFINSTSNYEFEIRLIENKLGAFNALLKLFTLEDKRFSYREEVIATSIKPVNAALTYLLASDYLKEDAKILDPFCGTGTMLIERHKFCKANTMYGVDLYGDAIEKAKKNTEYAHQIIHYINRDFFDFKHEYLFDEIVTNMPFAIGRTSEEEIYQLYERFFEKAEKHLVSKGIIVLYSHNQDLVRRFSKKYGYMLQKEWEISKKEGTFVSVVSKE